jgi:hypothetical protein
MLFCQVGVPRGQPSQRKPLRRPTLEELEVRSCPSVTIQIDYSLDTNHFFDTAAKKDVMQLAASTLGSGLSDSLLPIAPQGTNQWTASIINPATGGTSLFPNLNVPGDTLIVYAGGRPLDGSELGEGGPGGYQVSGSPDWQNVVAARGQTGALATPPTDFGPWGGSVSFDTNANWYFGTSTTGLGATQTDFLSVACHELGHLLGVGTAPSWNAQVGTDGFVGTHAVAEYGQGDAVPLNGDNEHWAPGTQDHGPLAAMNPSLAPGKRTPFTHLDWAALQDIGWNANPQPHGTTSTATDTGLWGVGSVTMPPATLVSPTEVDMYYFHASAGQQLTLSTTATANGSLADTYLRLFDANGQELQADDNSGSPSGYSELTYSIPADGVYYVGVSGAPNTSYSPTDPYTGLVAGSTGSYSLQVTLAEQSTSLGSFQLSATNYTVDETAGAVQITVQRTTSYARIASINYATANGTAVGGVNYVATSGTLSFAPGETSKSFTVPIRNDGQATGNLTFTVALSAPTGEAGLGSPATALVTIIDAGVQPPPPPPPPTPSPTTTPPTTTPSDATVDPLNVIEVFLDDMKVIGGGRRVKQKVTIFNNSNVAFQGPLYLILDRLPRPVFLQRMSGRTAKASPLGSPYLTVSLTSGVLDAYGSVQMVLNFANPRHKRFPIHPRLAIGQDPP